MVKSNFKKTDLIYRKLKLSDYHQFKELFRKCFNKKISYDFFKWRYFSDKYTFCYGAFDCSRLIANVGMFSLKLNNNKQERIFSRHSSMVLKNYRGYGVFSFLLNKVKKMHLKKIRLLVMWPNKNNYANFGINKENIIKKKYYIYKTSFGSNSLKTRNIYNIGELVNFKYMIGSKNNFFFKDFNYFKNRYLSYKKQEYLIDKFQYKKFESFFVLKLNQVGLNKNYVIVDHFGSEEIKPKHLTSLITNQKKIIFLSEKKINQTNVKLLNCLNFKIGFVKKYSQKEKKILHRKKIFLGDTDIFMTTGKI